MGNTLFLTPYFTQVRPHCAVTSGICRRKRAARPSTFTVIYNRPRTAPFIRPRL